MKANEIKKGHAVRHEGELYRVVGLQHVQKGNWRSYYQVQLRNMKRGGVISMRLGTDDELDYVEVTREPMQYLYRDGDSFCFMDNKSFEQVMVPKAQIEEQLPYLVLNGEVQGQFIEGILSSIEMPPSVVLRVKETTSGFKGDTVSNLSKPATLETGLEVKVPLYISDGDMVKVDTKTGEFLERVQEKK